MEEMQGSQEGSDPRFGGIVRLYGREGLARLRQAHVCVVGVGGVGSWTVEALARSGIGSISMVDFDEVCLSNVNRQLHSLTETVGMPKVAVLAQRVAQIAPDCNVHAEQEFFTASTSERFFTTPYDWVVDAIDVPAHKCLLIAGCKSRGLNVLTVGGAGGKRDGAAVLVNDLAFTGQDQLLKVVRRDLRKDYGFPKDPAQLFDVPCVYSPEAPVYPWANGEVCQEREKGGALARDCSSGFGAATFVTGVFGFVAAGEVVARIAVG